MTAPAVEGPGRRANPGWGRDTGRTTPPAQRGRLRIADRVLARIAWLAARDALVAATASMATAAAGEPPRVAVSVSGSSARIRVGVDLPFPSDLAALAGAVRDAVAERVGALTGIPAREVVVVVERLLLPAEGAES